MGYFEVIFKYASGMDKFLFIMASICSIGFGCLMPAFCILFGDLISSVGKGNDGGAD